MLIAVIITASQHISQYMAMEHRKAQPGFHQLSIINNNETLIMLQKNNINKKGVGVNTKIFITA